MAVRVAASAAFARIHSGVSKIGPYPAPPEADKETSLSRPNGVAAILPKTDSGNKLRIMIAIDWQLAAAVATVISTVAFIASAVVVVLQLRQAARERYFSITAHLFEIWQSPDFQHDQLFLLHTLSCTSWDEFCGLGRGERAERAIHRVGAYYDRVGNLVRHGLIDKRDMLPTVGGYAVAVWHRIEPLVKELRLRENAVLFQNYESLLPDCHECYVPGIAASTPASAGLLRLQPSSCTIELSSEAEFKSDSEAAPILPDAVHASNAVSRSTIQMENENGISSSGARIAPDLSLRDTDGIAHTLSEFTAFGPAVLVYARGAWCPFCLRQLSDYGERYPEFKRSGVEVVAISPESPRKARRMRTGLKLPFTVLADTNFAAAHTFGLIGQEKPGVPAPATLIHDAHRAVRLSALNEGGKCIFARDALEYGRALKQKSDPAAGSSAGVPLSPPPLADPKPGILFARAIANMAVGMFSR
jgi:peroxiredoxin